MVNGCCCYFCKASVCAYLVTLNDIDDSFHFNNTEIPAFSWAIFGVQNTVSLLSTANSSVHKVCTYKNHTSNDFGFHREKYVAVANCIVFVVRHRRFGTLKTITNARRNHCQAYTYTKFCMFYHFIIWTSSWSDCYNFYRFHTALPFKQTSISVLSKVSTKKWWAPTTDISSKWQRKIR